MIRKSEVMPLLVVACPSFADRWNQHTARWKNDTPPLYVSLEEFAKHLVELFRADKTREFLSVFRAVEKLHAEGDPDVKEAAMVGLLDRMTDVAENAGVDPFFFVPFLGPESTKWWESNDGA